MLKTIKNRLLTVTVSEDGAELYSILGADGTEYLWQGDPAYWSDRALNIFPFVARLFGGKYSLDGETCEMKIHGIAPYRRFETEMHGDSSLSLVLTSDADTRAEYPRDFLFRVRYELCGDTLAVTYEVENRDGKAMYFGLGGHPGFNVPLKEGKTFDSYRLRFSEKCSPERVGFTADCFTDGTFTPFPLEGGDTLPLSHSLFDDDAIVLRNMDRSVTLEADGDGHSITVSFPGMQYLGIWHMPRTDAPYVCIEPWCSLPSHDGEVTVFEKKPDLIALAPGETYKNTWTVTCKNL